MSRIILTVGAVAAVAIVVAWLCAGKSAPYIAPPTSPHIAVRASSSMTLAPSRPSPTVPLARRPPAEPASDTDADQGVASPPTAKEVRDGLDAHFWREAVDTSWSIDATRELDRKLPEFLPPGSTVRGVACRGSLCRIETVHVGLAEFQQFVQHAFLSQTRLANSGFVASVLDEPVDGHPIATVAFVAREGRKMPTPDDLVAP